MYVSVFEWDARAENVVRDCINLIISAYTVSCMNYVGNCDKRSFNFTNRGRRRVTTD